LPNALLNIETCSPVQSDGSNDNVASFHVFSYHGLEPKSSDIPETSVDLALGIIHLSTLEPI
jgi:hypothetical protein